MTAAHAPRRSVVFARLPRLRWRPPAGSDLVDPSLRADHGDLEQRFSVLDDELLPAFRDCDHRALEAQNRFRLERLALLIGSALAVIAGAVQTALADARWPGVVQAVIAAAVVGVAVRVRSSNAQRGYLDARLRAERLRGEYFRYLGTVGDYAADDRPERLLRQRVADIVHSGSSP